MPSIKDYKDKIKSLKNTQKITRTMKMVSASKLRKAQDTQSNAKLYAHTLTGLTSRVAASLNEQSHKLMTPKTEVKKILIVAFTSDKGLCGAFNNNTNKRVLQWVNDHKDTYEQIDLSFCGKRGFMFFHKIGNVKTHYENVTGNPNFLDAKKIGEELSELYINSTYDEIYLAYSEFLSPLSQRSTFEKILPISPREVQEENVQNNKSEYLFEPKQEKLLEFLIPHFLFFKIYFALLENWAGEHGARMTAMDNATKNASELIEKNTLLRNRARQAAITTELTEIVAGAEALN